MRIGEPIREFEIIPDDIPALMPVPVEEPERVPALVPVPMRVS